MKDLTICIKTLSRPYTLDRTLESIRAFYPNVKIIVADDSKEPIVNSKADHYFTLDYDVGVSYGRNFLINKVDTPYYLVTDDDSLFTEETRLDKLLYIIKNYNVDIVTGLKSQRNKLIPLQTFEIIENIQKVNLWSFNKNSTIPIYDFGPVFFIAKPSLSEKVQWDDELKTSGEHMEFFISAQKADIKTTACIQCRYIDAKTDKRDAAMIYNKYRGRRSYKELSFKKHGITSIQTIDPKREFQNLYDDLTKSDIDDIFWRI